MNKLLYILLLIIFSLLFQSCNQQEVIRGDEDWSFIVFGDIRRGYGVYSKIVSNISKIEPHSDLAICMGDVMHVSGNEVEWENFWRYSKPLTDIMPIYFARGNHEGNDVVSEIILREQIDFFKERDTFYYSVFHKKQHFLILDTFIRNQGTAIINEQLEWLIHQLDSTSNHPNIDNLFIFMHHPLYPQGKYKGHNLANADYIHTLFTKYTKIRAVFASHEHSYSYYEKEGVKYFISGGAGAELYSGYGGDFFHFMKISFYEDTKRINFKTIGIFNETVEEFDL